jgi:hypothetical protein
MIWPWSRKDGPEPRKENPITREDYDRIHERIRINFMVSQARGEQFEVSGKDRYRLTYICSSCDQMHDLEGSFDQVQATATAFLLGGYPFLQIVNLGLVEVANMEGLSLETNEKVQQVSKLYKEFLEATRD